VPASWQPNDEHRALALEHGKNFDLELAKYRDHTFGSARSDADATFRNWLRNERGFGGAKPMAPRTRLLTHAEHAAQAANQQLPDWAKG